MGDDEPVSSTTNAASAAMVDSSGLPTFTGPGSGPGWSPRIDLREGLTRTIESLRAELAADQGMAPSPP